MRRTRSSAIPADDNPKILRVASIGTEAMSACEGRRGRYRVKTPEIYSNDQLQVVAHLYYRERLDQRRIAGLLNLSQAKVSRMLTVARDRGIVRVFVAECEPRDRTLERRIQRRFGLDAVAVIRTPDGLTAENKRQFVAYFSSPFITSLISPQTNVVVAGGRTIGELIRRLPEDRDRHVTVLQALGIVGSSLAHVDALEIGRTLARRWGGPFMAMDTPAIAPDRWTRDSILRQSKARAVWQRLGRADAAIVAVGTPTNSVFANRYVASDSDRAVLTRCGAIGEMCGRFFDRSGRECDSPWRDQVISVELDYLRTFPQVVAIVVGPDRSSAIAGAIRGGLLKSLAIDVEGAQALLRKKTV
jgi:DNA-binding transcriptional regulator LsrR (DeoR family)